MAYGIDDVFTAVTGVVKLAETIVTIVKKYREKKQSVDLEQLLQEVRVTALGRIDEADIALTRFERTLIEKHIDINKRRRYCGTRQMTRANGDNGRGGHQKRLRETRVG
jgi:hypothetical protein